MNPGSPNASGWAELQRAVIEADLAAIRQLLERGVCPYKKDCTSYMDHPSDMPAYRSALENAAIMGNTDVMQMLLTEAPVPYSLYLENRSVVGEAR